VFEDMLICSGWKSTTRQLMYKRLGLVDKARPTGDAAFRALIPIDKISDPELQAFVSDPVGTRWMGPGRHIQGYPIRHKKLYNMVSVLV
jgi:salicylate hydroxylase